MISSNETVAFDMYFASLASMQLHPGAGMKDHKQMTLEECRDMALNMIDLRRFVIPNEES